jgi:hypothetical protein
MSHWRQTNATIVLTNVPDRLKDAYRIYMALPVEEKINISQGMTILMDKCSNMGPQGAFEVVYEIGLFLAMKGEKEKKNDRQ